MINRIYNLLILEDDPDDVKLIRREIDKSNIKFRVRTTDNKSTFESLIRTFNPDVILSDCLLPGYSGLEALNVSHLVCPNALFIFVTGAIGEELAAETILNGAHGFVLKNNLKKIPEILDTILLQEQELRQQGQTDPLVLIHHYLEKVDMNSELSIQKCLEIKEMIERQINNI